ncbi:MAG: pyridoxal phosphate-dependent transferase [Bacteroidetes bacterium]|nr:pyridoxal phosphate-dependent transferase [Bacteroidota bacterium]
MTKREEILNLVKEYYKETFSNTKEFEEGDTISYGGRIFDETEMVNLVDSSLDFWLTSGRYCNEFESQMAKMIGVKHLYLVNSGSSANLLAFMTLTSDRLGDRKINRGDEVITVAAGFPTTITPMIQYGAIPVFVDVTIPEYNIDCSKLEDALSEKTKAVMVAHTLGNPFNLEKVRDFCKKHNLWLVEDNCDALGSEYFIDGQWKKTGTIGDIGTSSFYPPHHMTMGEGGAVYTNDSTLGRIAMSFRDWGRDCYCPSGKDDTCKHRFTQQFGELPMGYDHKYVYSHFGYNLKVTEMQASIGLAQLKKLDTFTNRRRENFDYLLSALKQAGAENKLILPIKEENSNPSWFGFLITVREDAGFTRNDLVQYLENNKIQTRMLFAGNLIKHPCFDQMRKTKEGFRVVGELKNSDLITNNTFWIGVYPGMTKEKLDFMINHILCFINRG